MPVQLKRKKEIKKGIQDYFFEYVLDCKNKYQISSLLKEAVEETLIDKLNYIDREDFLFLTDDKEEMEFINEHLAELIYEISDITGVWAIFVQHLCSDGRFKHPLTSYYIGEDSEGCISYVITGDGDPYIDYDISYSSVFESLLEDLGMKHPDRAMKAIKNYIKENEKTLKEYEGNIWGIEIDPDENYVVINSSRDQFDLIPDSCLKEISTEYYDTGMDTILYYKKKGRFIKISISRYQGSPDYVAKIAKIKGEDIALGQYLKKIHKDRIAIINPYPPYDVLKVIDSDFKSCRPKDGWIFNPEKHRFEGNGDQRCPPPNLH